MERIVINLFTILILTLPNSGHSRSSLQNSDLTGIATPWGKYWMNTLNESSSLVPLLREVLTPLKGVEIKDRVLTNIQLTRMREQVTFLPIPNENNIRDDQPVILKLVDPSLHSYTEGVTKLNSPASTRYHQELNEETKRSMDPAFPDYSKKFQWLPTEVFVDPVTRAVKFDSYINNLNPRHHPRLSRSLETIIQSTIQPFENIISVLLKDNGGGHAKRISLDGRQLQMIIGMKSIHLAPKAPYYNGSDWHIEGLLNERIVASAIFYYDMENINESRLSFRVQTAEDNFTDLGYALAKSNRLIAFPNIYQHKVEPFEMEDPTRAGFRKIVSIFLVDPARRITSTADVMPQQANWKSGDDVFVNRERPNRFDINKGRFLDVSPMDPGLARVLRDTSDRERKNRSVQCEGADCRVGRTRCNLD